jgi:Na+/H+ antiporter NhaB
LSQTRNPNWQKLIIITFFAAIEDENITFLVQVICAGWMVVVDDVVEGEVADDDAYVIVDE